MQLRVLASLREVLFRDSRDGDLGGGTGQSDVLGPRGTSCPFILSGHTRREGRAAGEDERI